MVATKALPSVAAGSIFGAALLAACVYQPSVIVSQMSLTNFHMLQTFLTASASSAVMIALAGHFGIAKAAPRPSSTLNWFSAYDANILGGLLQGIGMALTGACPGTVLVQIATGSNIALFIAVGGMCGAIIYTKLAPFLIRRRSPTSESPSRRQPSSPEGKKTVQEYLLISSSSMVLVYELFCLAILAISVLLPQGPHWLHPIAGGILIGLAQTTSLYFHHKAVGISSAYEDLAKYFWKQVDGGGQGQLLTPSVLFTAGVFAGALSATPFIPPAAVSPLTLSKSGAVTGGIVLIFGARLAGGCASGHGISGMSAFSISSIITVVSMFAGGIATATLLK